MKTLILSVAISIGCMITKIALCQSYSSYTTESKRCGKCQKQVSNDSRPGMTCPHCGARWSRENTHYSQETSYSYAAPITPSYSGIMTSSNANLRSYPSLSASVKTVIPAFSNLKYLDMVGNWVKVKYTYYDFWYGTVYETGWVHVSLINIY